MKGDQIMKNKPTSIGIFDSLKEAQSAQAAQGSAQTTQTSGAADENEAQGAGNTRGDKANRRSPGDGSPVEERVTDGHLTDGYLTDRHLTEEQLAEEELMIETKGDRKGNLSEKSIRINLIHGRRKEKKTRKGFELRPAALAKLQKLAEYYDLSENEAINQLLEMVEFE